ncbi:hypothetical protein [Methylobacterium nigriterrae]|uniref:hypothetical protein n=1 Tax=Methylobacterium nigriterrae TaxID=3127512 RepID=UPI003013B0DE
MRLQAALRHFLKHGKLAAAAQAAGVSAERLRRSVYEQKLAERQAGRLRRVVREALVTSRGRQRWIKAGFEAASRIGSHNAAVGQFLQTNDASLLAPFEGEIVIDLSGKRHPLETDPNTLYRLAAAGSEGFEQVYRLTTL